MVFNPVDQPLIIDYAQKKLIKLTACVPVPLIPVGGMNLGVILRFWDGNGKHLGVVGS